MMSKITSQRRRGAEEGLSLEHWSFTRCKQQEVPIREEQILISHVARIFSVVLKRQLFCFILFINLFFDDLNIIRRGSQNPHSKIWFWIGVLECQE